MPFKQFGLPDEIVRGVQAAGYTDPTPIQLRAIPLVMTGKDVIGSAQTGTGKTAAFALPILSLLKTHGKLRCLVLVPTRELAAQVETAYRDYGRFTNLRTVVIFGGVGYGQQKQDLQRGVDVVVATPGRLLDLLGQGTLHLNDISILVLDEADRMLDMGFMPDVRRIIEHCPRQRQTMLFSATIPPEIERLAAWALRTPERLQIGAIRSPAETVTHACYPVASSQKYQLLAELLKRTNYDSVLIFSRTKHGADKIAHRLKADNHAVAALHSNRTQRERVEALEGFKSGKYEVMVATDIAARGIDVEDISHVINYDVPQHPEDYVHRIGRTGRALKVGDAYTLVTSEELDDIRAIERFIGQKIPRMKLDNFDYVLTPLFDEDKISSRRDSVRGGRTSTGYSFAPSRRRR